MPQALDPLQEAQIQHLIDQMTIEEKVAMTAGATPWSTAPVERLGIPALRMTDGPSGARGAGLGTQITAACFPAGIALAATWNPELVAQVGQALAEETLDKGCHLLLGPTTNMHRTPVNGRNFECYSEDPYLAGRMVAAYIQGLQSRGVSACVKHLVANDSEYQRNTISSEVRERALREIYLPPFETAVKEANAWALMSAYNRLNGTYCSEHSWLLRDVLKGEWGFPGLVTSDWFGTYSTVEAANAGLDLEMPGPPRFRGDKLLAAVRSGQVAEEVLDEAVRRILRVLFWTGRFDHPEEQTPRSQDRPEHRAISRRAAAEGTVLLKNSGVLPLDLSKVQRIAVIGPAATDVTIMGGGSAQVNPYYVVQPLDAIRARVAEHAQVDYAKGCHHHRFAAVLRGPTAQTPDGRPGVLVEYFPHHPDAPALLQEVRRNSELLWFDGLPEGVDPRRCRIRVQTVFTPQESGPHTFGLLSAGPAQLWVDGRLLLDNSDPTPGIAYFGMASQEIRDVASLDAGRPVHIAVEYRPPEQPVGPDILRFGVLEPLPADAIARAADLAAQAGVALVFVGTDSDWESEGYDRESMDLPGPQNALVEAVAQANPNTVVVLNTGSPVTMPWLDQVAAVLEVWFPGQEAGNAIADVLFGDVNPAGRLPQTFPRRLPDNPGYINYPGENGRVYYGEGVFIGYRYYEKKQIPPLFPFGHGLSYTRFEYGPVTLNGTTFAPGDAIRAEVTVTNVGDRPGQEVVQLYVADPEARVLRPEKELRRFAKVHLEPGASASLTFELDQRALAFYDDRLQRWVAEAGEYQVLVGASSADIRGQATFTLTGDWLGEGPGAQVRYDLKTPLAQLLEDPRAREILARHFPDMIGSPLTGMALGFSLEQLASMAPDMLPPQKLAALEADLARLGGTTQW